MSRKTTVSGKVSLGENTSTKQVIVKPVESAIRILRLLGNSGRPSTVTIIARELAINTSTCFNILRTLVASNVLDFDADTKTYAISTGAIGVANSAILTGGVAGEMQRRMEEVAHRYGITVGLWRRVGEDRVLLVWLVESPTAVRIMLRLGQRLPLLIGASGRVMCAFSKFDAEEIERRFASLRWHAPLSLQQYLSEVAQTAQQGYAIDNGTFIRGALGIAAPIFERDRSVRSIVSSTSFVGQHDSGDVNRIAEEVKRLGADLTRLLTEM
ncbi:IclR family transcriptional regulator [Aquibium sp. LZ166]|uniref:IclR family transcriptional regulator n=1 Tax=Aquibium pacificus TaxID=3153579 RepID=A0ABV3SKI7_9HYPH